MSPDGTHQEHAEERVKVDLGARSYDIVIGRSLLARAGELSRAVLAQPRVYIVTDENVARHHLATVVESFKTAGVKVDTLVLPAGEATKDIRHLAQVLDAMLAAKCERKTMIVALGGGVIGDLAGFAASVLLRGVDFIQIPTTLLAQVDSSVGGKTGINAGAGKNLIGAFHQPRLVLADTDALATLPRRELMAGYAEVVKYGLIRDAGFYDWLEAHGADALSDGEGAHAPLAHCIKTSCLAKAAVVAADEKESGERALLNLGHTFAHAFEAEMGYGDDLLHGEAVAMGMIMAFDLSVRMGLCPAADAQRVRAHLAAAGLRIAPPTRGPHGVITAARLIAHMAGDKKTQDGVTTFVLARRIGDAFLSRDVRAEDLTAVLTDALSATR